MGATASQPGMMPAYGPGYGPPMMPIASGISTTSSVMIGLFVGILVIIVMVAAYRTTTAKATIDQAPTPISGKAGGTIPASGLPLNAGSDYGLQFWMFVQDWDYKFGTEKEVLLRKDPTNPSTVNPRVTLHPTDNTLNVYLTTYPSRSGGSGAAAAAGSADGSSWSCSVENIPLQTWFSVSITVFQRNMDVFINGNLVKSSVITGVPRSAVGDVLVGANGGFAGYVCNVHGYGTQIMPADARAFYAAGTTCSSLVSQKSSPTGTSYNLFGYTIIIQDSAGKAVSTSAALAGWNKGINETLWAPAGAGMGPANCLANTWSDSGKDVDGLGTGCTACPAGSTAPIGATGCACPTGKTWSAATNACS